MLSKTVLPTAKDALPGRDEALQVAGKHAVNGNSTLEPFPAGHELAMFGMGCFWGAEQLFWKQKGIFSTQVGYVGGYTPNPTYQEVCTGFTAHVEVVRIVFDPKVTSYKSLLKLFWEKHNPTEGMKQGDNEGTQYRSVIFTYGDQQREDALLSKDNFQKLVIFRLQHTLKPSERGRQRWYRGNTEPLERLIKTQELNHINLGTITTEIYPAPVFYYAEDYHQQYLHKKPDGYCGLKGTGVTCTL